MEVELIGFDDRLDVEVRERKNLVSSGVGILFRFVFIVVIKRLNIYYEWRILLVMKILKSIKS